MNLTHSTIKKPAIADGLKCTGALLRALNVTADRFVFFEDCLVTVCPVGKPGERENGSFLSEMERGLVLKQDGDCVILVVGEEFHFVHDLAFDFGKLQDFSAAHFCR